MHGAEYIDSYLKWLREKITFAQIGDITEITTPFLDQHNDYIQIYVRRENGKLLITDGGWTVGDLIACGCDPNPPKRKEILNALVSRVGVSCRDMELVVEANETNFPQKKHALLQAIMSVNDMFMISHNRVIGIFTEDVDRFLLENEIYTSKNIQIIGKSGFNHIFDFLLTPTKKRPEIFISAVNSISQDKVQSLLFSWNDIRYIRPEKSRMVVFLNDTDKQIKPAVDIALREYQVDCFPWSRRHDAMELLSA